MSRSGASLYDAPLWPAFKARYGADLSSFAEEVCGLSVDAESRAAYASASNPGACMVLSEIRNMSDARLAAVSLWAMLFHPRNDVVVISPRREVHKSHWALYKQSISGAHSWLGEYLHVTQAGVRTIAGYEGPRISFRTATNNAPENLAGMYGGRLFFMVEAAAGVSDRCMQVLRASFCTPLLSEVLALSRFTIVQTTD